MDTKPMTRFQMFCLLFEPPHGWGDEEEARDAYEAFEQRLAEEQGR